MARPIGTGKPQGTKYQKTTFSCPPDLLAEVRQWIPERERSPIIQDTLRREVKRRKRLAQAEGVKVLEKQEGGDQ